jgi:hypothetical protein
MGAVLLSGSGATRLLQALPFAAKGRPYFAAGQCWNSFGAFPDHHLNLANRASGDGMVTLWAVPELASEMVMAPGRMHIWRQDAPPASANNNGASSSRKRGQRAGKAPDSSLASQAAAPGGEAQPPATAAHNKNGAPAEARLHPPAPAWLGGSGSGRLLRAVVSDGSVTAGPTAPATASAAAAAVGAAVDGAAGTVEASAAAPREAGEAMRPASAESRRALRAKAPPLTVCESPWGPPEPAAEAKPGVLATRTEKLSVL